MDPTKIKAIKNWSNPKTRTDIQSFLSMAGYYRRFIKNFSEIVGLLIKSKPFIWADKKEEALQTLKGLLYEAPILSLPERNKDFVIYSDASYFGSRCVLM